MDNSIEDTDCKLQLDNVELLHDYSERISPPQEDAGSLPKPERKAFTPALVPPPPPLPSPPQRPRPQRRPQHRIPPKLMFVRDSELLEDLPWLAGLGYEGIDNYKAWSELEKDTNSLLRALDFHSTSSVPAPFGLLLDCGCLPHHLDCLAAYQRAHDARIAELQREERLAQLAAERGGIPPSGDPNWQPSIVKPPQQRWRRSWTERQRRQAAREQKKQEERAAEEKELAERELRGLQYRREREAAVEQWRQNETAAFTALEDAIKAGQPVEYHGTLRPEIAEIFARYEEELAQSREKYVDLSTLPPQQLKIFLQRLLKAAAKLPPFPGR